MKSNFRACKVCGSSFKFYAAYESRGPTHGIYCSKKCRGEDRRTGLKKACPKCGKSFYAKAALLRDGYANFCSKKCWADTRVVGQLFSCIVCGVSFNRTPWQISHGWIKFCSRPCMDFTRRSVSYEAHKIRDKERFKGWQRKEWLESKCGYCEVEKSKGGKSLELDHIVPVFAGGSPDKSNAQTLCRQCNQRKYWHEDLPYYSWLKKHEVHN